MNQTKSCNPCGKEIKERTASAQRPSKSREHGLIREPQTKTAQNAIR